MHNINWLSSAHFAGCCPLCGSCIGHRIELGVDNPLSEGRRLCFVRCGGCASLFADPPGNRAYDKVSLPDDYLKYYLEAGAGPHAMLRRAAAVRGAHGRDFLDVGCGYGFAVDAWRRCMEGTAVGVELAQYGRVGAQRLGITVYDRSLGSIPELAGKRFGIVQAIEVIEHVPDVPSFLSDLESMLAPSGVLVLSTPSAEFIHRENSPAEILALLSPGFHAFLFSRGVLEAVLRTRFRHVVVKIERETLSAWASHDPFEIDESAVDPLYLSYLEQLWLSCAEKDSLHDGAAFRLFKERLNRGDIAGAALPMRVLEASYLGHYGSSVLDPEQAIRLGAISDIAAYRQLPYALAAYHYYRAVYARLAEKDAARAARHFRAASRIALAGGEVAPEKFQEALSLTWIARQQEGLAWAAAGDIAAARMAFSEVLAAYADREKFPTYPDAALVQAVAGHLRDIGG